MKDWFLDKAVGALLVYKSRASLIRRIIASRRLRRASPVSQQKVTVAVVQMQLELVDDGVQFAERYCELAGEAIDQGAQLVVFPEYAWLPILGLIPAVRDLSRMGVTLDGAVQELSPGGELTLKDVLRTVAPAVKRVFETTAAGLASRCGIYLMPGTALTMDTNGLLYNTAYMFGPDGALLGTQDKLHPTPMEKDWLTCGSRLHVWSTPFGGIAAPVCMDFTFWEVARVATARGADILLDMSADAMADQPYMGARGDESRIQESYAYSSRAYCLTHLFGLNFCGPSHIAAPLGLYHDDTPYLARADRSDREQVITFELDMERLKEFRAAHPRDWNPRLYKKYLPNGYDPYRDQSARQGRRILS